MVALVLASVGLVAVLPILMVGFGMLELVVAAEDFLEELAVSNL